MSRIRSTRGWMTIGGFVRAVLVAFVVLTWGATACGNQVPAPIRPVKAEVGYSAPDFELRDLAGRRVKLSDYYGKIVILNFWATWCMPCRQELPALQSLYEKRGKEVVLLAISQGEAQEDVAAFVQKYGLTFSVLLDPQLSVGQAYKANTIPITYVIDREGVIQYKRRGTVAPGELDLVIASLLKAGLQ